MGPTWHQVAVERTQQARNLGIVVNADFKPMLQCRKAAKKAWCALYQIKKTVGFMRLTVLLPLFKALVRPHLKYFVHAWGQYSVGGVKMLEKVHRVFTR